jgi:ammonia channel protein AmtB
MIRQGLPILIFLDPIACWTWNPAGWSYVLGGLDFSGGTVVHISSGTAGTSVSFCLYQRPRSMKNLGLAISLYLGPRRGYGQPAFGFKPHNSTYVVLGTVFIWSVFAISFFQPYLTLNLISGLAGSASTVVPLFRRTFGLHPHVS